MFAQDKWTISRATINAGLRWDWFISATRSGNAAGRHVQPGGHAISDCSDGKNNLNAGLHRPRANWKDISPRARRRVRPVRQRQDGDQGQRRALRRTASASRPAASPTTTTRRRLSALTDTRAWTDLDSNGSPFDAAGAHPAERADRLDRRRRTSARTSPSSTTTDPAVLDGWGARGYNWEYTVSGQHELAPRVSVDGGWYRRKFGNQTVTVDNRYSFAKGSYDGPFCAERAGRSEPAWRRRLPGVRPVRPQAGGRRAAAAAEQHAEFSSQLRRRDQHLRGLRRLDQRRGFEARRVLQRRHQRAEAHLRSVQPRRRRHPVRPDVQRRRTGRRSPRSSRTATRPAIRICRIVPTSSCSARTRCRSTSS